MKHALLLGLAFVSFAAAPEIKPAAIKPPATKPTPAPTRVRDGMANGSIRFLVPVEWELSSRAESGFSVVYQFPEEKGSIILLATQQNDVIPAQDAGVKKQLAKFVLEKDNEDLAKRKMELIDPPKLESDARFMVKVHERFKDGDATVDAIHLYRGVGFNLISITVSVNTEDKDEAKRLHDAGAMMLMSVTIGPKDPKVMRPLKKEE